MSTNTAGLPQERSFTRPPWTWDVFCRVIDNFGDIGVCWRLCADLAQRGHTVRLWIDDSSALAWMAPGAQQGLWPGIRVEDWSRLSDASYLQRLAPADVWVEGFGCSIAPEFIAHHANSMHSADPTYSQPPAWINLEYLSAEDYVTRCHALPSPVMQGPAQGWTKHFYYPGFSPGTGGLLREPPLETWQRGLDPAWRPAWLAAHGVDWHGERLISLFCYEPAALPQALADWMQSSAPVLLLITPGRAAHAVTAALPQARVIAGLQHDMGQLRLHYLESMSQVEFDALLHCCDLNLVRGEDSLVRAIWAGNPFVWNIYPQEDGAHASKLLAFLERMEASSLVRQLHLLWNGLELALPATALHPLPHWGRLPLDDWQRQVRAWRTGLQGQPDLVTGLIGFLEKRR